MTKKRLSKKKVKVYKSQAPISGVEIFRGFSQKSKKDGKAVFAELFKGDKFWKV